MTLGETLISVWQRSLADGKKEVQLAGESFPVTVFRAKKLRSVEFGYGDLRIVGIEQNPQAASRWAALARQGNQIMQFRCKGRYIANVREGTLLRYPASTALRLARLMRSDWLDSNAINRADQCSPRVRGGADNVAPLDLRSRFRKRGHGHDD